MTASTAEPETMIDRLIIAIDGPAASGKGTLARRLASQYRLRHLDTGLTYRAVARALLESGQALDDETLALRRAVELDMDRLDRGLLSSHRVGEAASKVAVMPAVRRALVAKQRAFAAPAPGAVLDGRDIGTVVCPQADVKLYVTARPQVRARRRFEELARHGSGIAYEQVLGDILSRDARDTQRADSPLRPAPDAHLIDTSEMDIDTAFRAACAIIDRTLAERK